MTATMKKYVAVWGALFFFVICISLYLMMETVNTSPGRFPEFDTDSLDLFEKKIGDIQKDIVKNHKTISEIKDAVRKLSKGDKESMDRLKKILDMKDEESEVVQMEQKSDSKNSKSKDAWKFGQYDQQKTQGNYALMRKEVSVSDNMCSWADEPKGARDMQTQHIFEILPFDNPDGGVWKQGWDIRYAGDKWNKNRKLKVFVVPHSHNDPGWVKTFEDYYRQQTRQILSLMVDKLEQHREMTFIYAEMSFFSLWWSEINDEKKNRVRKLLKEGRFEIVTGGWVMTDEANAHYFAMLDQLIEGHQWLNGTLGTKPVSGWAIDPFGHTPTMAYLLRRSGFKNMLIQRVHYSVKKHLARNKQLEFMWRQTWDKEGTTDILCHMMPFYSYDVPHTCGPDPKICCQFDFRRLPGSSYNCPWRIAPQKIQSSNVAERATLLIDQYKKKAELYRSDALFIPLGDDFRYDKAEEWDYQFENYNALFKYINSHPELGVETKFGTLTDYFRAISDQWDVKMGQKPGDYPVHSGDFFTYSDRDDHYWSGYYTSKPFYKSLDRITEHHLRAAEIIYSQAVVSSRRSGHTKFPVTNFMNRLIGARRNLGLFQHHDGITGTAKDFAVVDYGNRLLSALRDMQTLIAESVTYMMSEDRTQYSFSEDSPIFNVDESRERHDSIAVKTVLKLSNTPSPVLLYNPLGQSRDQVISLYVDHPHLTVFDPTGQVIMSQVDPVWTPAGRVIKDKYRVSFRGVIPAIGVTAYTIKKSDAHTNSKNVLVTISILNPTQQDSTLELESFKFVKLSNMADFTMESPGIKAKFSGSTGLLKSVTTKADNIETKMEVEFVKYGTVAAKDKSGAYLFLPDGVATPVNIGRPVVHLTQGPILSEVRIYTEVVEHVVKLHNSSGVDGLTVDMYNEVDITTQRNYELAVRVSSGIKNTGREFYTDLNGFQMQKHKTYDKLPLQANLYPMPTMAFIEDGKNRFSVLSGQSLGVSNLKPGIIEVMLDRRLNQDDNRGLGQGVLDNKRTPSSFRLLLETRNKGTLNTKRTVGFPSLLAHQASLQLIHPVFIFPKNHEGSSLKIRSVHSPLNNDLPCDIHLLNLRTMQNRDDDSSLRFVPRNTAGVYLHRVGFDCSFPNHGLMCPTANGEVTLSNLFTEMELRSATSVSLTLMYDDQPVDTMATLTIEPMEIASYKVDLH